MLAELRTRACWHADLGTWLVWWHGDDDNGAHPCVHDRLHSQSGLHLLSKGVGTRINEIPDQEPTNGCQEDIMERDKTQRRVHEQEHRHPTASSAQHRKFLQTLLQTNFECAEGPQAPLLLNQG